MAKEKDDVFVIGDDGLDEIERNVLIKYFGKEEADKIIASANDEDAEDEPLDNDLQEIIDSAPALDEI